MKKNMKIEDLSPDQIRDIEELCKKADLQDLDIKEKIALNWLINNNFSNFPISNILDDNYPFTNYCSGAAGAPQQELQSLILLYILKRCLENSSKQSTLIKQNQQIIEQNQQLINQNQEVINLLKEIRDK